MGRSQHGTALLMTLALPSDDMRQSLPIADAITATGFKSRSAFYRWAAKWNLVSIRRQYARFDLAEAMAAEQREHDLAKRKAAKRRAAQ